jgi:hypothetical protein
MPTTPPHPTRTRQPPQEPIEQLTEAIRLTVEYVGTETLPPLSGWSWYDALMQYAPEKAQVFREQYDRATRPKPKNRSSPLTPTTPQHPTSAMERP